MIKDYLDISPTFADLKMNQSTSLYTMKIDTKILTSNLKNGSTSIKFGCYDQDNVLRFSNYFSIYIICGPDSVKV